MLFVIVKFIQSITMVIDLKIVSGSFPLVSALKCRFYYGLLLNGFSVCYTKEAAIVYFANYHQVYSDPLLSLILCLLMLMLYNLLLSVVPVCCLLLLSLYSIYIGL